MKSATSIVKKSLDADEAVDRLQADVIGVDEVRPLPIERDDRGVGFGPDARRLAVHDQVLAVGLVPDRRDVDAELLRLDERGELGLALMGEAIADPHRILRQVHG